MGETFLCTRGSFVLLPNVKGADSPQLQDGIDDPEGQMEIVADQDLELVRDLYLVCPQKGVSRVPGHNGFHYPQDTSVLSSMGRLSAPRKSSPKGLYHFSRTDVFLEFPPDSW